MFTIEVNDAEVKQAFGKVLDAGLDPRPYLDAIGVALKESARLRFIDGRGPDGNPWAPLSPVTIAKRRKEGRGAKPLRDTGLLMNSIAHRVDGNSVIVGPREKYGAFQQFGARRGQFGSGQYKTLRGSFPIPWGNVPGRPYIGLSRDDRNVVLGILRERLDRATS